MPPCRQDASPKPQVLVAEKHALDPSRRLLSVATDYRTASVARRQESGIEDDIRTFEPSQRVGLGDLKEDYLRARALSSTCGLVDRAVEFRGVTAMRGTQLGLKGAQLLNRLPEQRVGGGLRQMTTLLVALQRDRGGRLRGRSGRGRMAL